MPTGDYRPEIDPHTGTPRSLIGGDCVRNRYSSGDGTEWILRERDVLIEQLVRMKRLTQVILGFAESNFDDKDAPKLITMMKEKLVKMLDITRNIMRDGECIIPDPLDTPEEEARIRALNITPVDLSKVDGELLVEEIKRRLITMEIKKGVL